MTTSSALSISYSLSINSRAESQRVLFLCKLVDMNHSDPDGSPLARKRSSTRRKFVKEVYRPSNRKLPPNSRMWGSENLNDVSEDTTTSKKVKRSLNERNSEQGQKDIKDAKVKPSRKVANVKRERLTDKSNSQKKLGTNLRITRASAMTNTRGGRPKIDVLDEEEASKTTQVGEPEELEDIDDHFLDVSADYRIHPIAGTSKPTQQSLGADVTFTFDIDRHARALADCPPIPRARSVSDQGQNTGGVSDSKQFEPPPPSPTRGPKIKLPNTKSSQQYLNHQSSPKKRTRNSARAGTSKDRVANGPLSDDPLMI